MLVTAFFYDFGRCFLIFYWQPAEPGYMQPAIEGDLQINDELSSWSSVGITSMAFPASLHYLNTKSNPDPNTNPNSLFRHLLLLAIQLNPLTPGSRSQNAWVRRTLLGNHLDRPTVTSWWFHDTVAARLVVGLSPLRVRWNGTRFHTHSGVPTASDRR